MNDQDPLTTRPPTSTSAHTSAQVTSSVPEIPQAFEASQPRFYIKRVPPTLTRILIGINIAVFLIMTLYGFMLYQTWNGTMITDVLIRFGAKEAYRIYVLGEYWRLFTAMFIHIGPMHLAFNLYALYALGPMVEGYYGHWRFLAIYVIAGLSGSLASYAFSPAPSAGASGAIFGLAGAITVYFLKYRENFGAQGKAILQNMLFIIVINMVFGLSVGNIDNWGHIGGLIGGALVAWGLLPRYSAPTVVRMGAQPIAEENRRLIELFWVSVVVGLLVAGIYLANMYLIPRMFSGA